MHKLKSSHSNQQFIEIAPSKKKKKHYQNGFLENALSKMIPQKNYCDI